MRSDKKVVAVDIDGTIVDYDGYITVKGEEFFKKPVKDRRGYDIEQKFGVSSELAEQFWHIYYPDYLKNCPLISGVARALRYIHFVQGYDLVIASHRLLGVQKDGVIDPVYVEKGITQDVIMGEIKELMDRNCIPITSYECPDTYVSKADICNEIGAVYLFDDHPKEVPALIGKSNTTGILVRQSYNEHISTGVIMTDWADIKDIMIRAGVARGVRRCIEELREV